MNYAFFEIFSDLTEKGMYNLSIFFPKIKSSYTRQNLYSKLKIVGKDKRLKLAKYVESLLPYGIEDGEDLPPISEISSIDPINIPEVILPYVLVVVDNLKVPGLYDLIKNISSILKD